ncbi:hypothetical protein C8D94_10588 [Marinirhabdus gelatinilytica]|uniref:Uncharacterized protein n=1 Tax=Marinirhabdus gelatinilytica TaxID=1703343 RepID=A0A370Q7B2_9FLAO|nr:hypothetical protein C8D94_10588 [Marinirhabdus gelatinilytica]
MFKRVVTHKGFWKSVVVIGFVYAIALFLIQWMGTNFNSQFLSFSLKRIVIFLVGGFIVGFATTYGKFWGKLKQEDYKNK